MVELSQAAVWHRQVAAVIAAADRAGVAADQLPAVRARLLAQQTRFAEAAARTGVGLPALVPTPTEVSAAAPALGDLSNAAVGETIRVSHSTLDAVDAALASYLVPQAAPVPTPVLPVAVPTTMPGPPAGGAPDPRLGVPVAVAAPKSLWQSGARNALVYGAYALAVLVIQVVLLIVADEETTLPLLAPLCLFVLPAFAWLAGFVTIGIVFKPDPGQSAVKRTPRTGVAICLLPNLLLCAGLGVLFVIHR